MATFVQLLSLVLLAGAAGVQAQSSTQDKQLGVVARPQDIQCESEMQVVMCGQIPFRKVQERAACCAMHKPLPPQVHAAALAAAAAARPAGSWDWETALPDRVDLAENSPLLQPVEYFVGSCAGQVLAEVPTFHTITQQVAAGDSADNSSQPEDGSSNATPPAPVPVPASSPADSSSQKRRLAQSDADSTTDGSNPAVPITQTVQITSVEVTQATVPVLSSAQIRRIKSTALALQPIEVQRGYSKLAHINAESGFLHPTGYAGPAELALLQHRLAQQQPVQAAALDSLLTGAKAPPKVYEGAHAAYIIPELLVFCVVFKMLCYLAYIACFSLAPSVLAFVPSMLWKS
jgi:hypothetical protein